jgi:hypothetical protein
VKKIRFLIAAGLVAASLALVLKPELLSVFSQTLQRIEQQGKLLMTLLFLVTGLYTLFAAKPSGKDTSEFPVEEEPEEPSTKEGELVGDELEDMIENRETTDIRRRLEEDAEEALMQSRGLSKEEARKTIREGGWTEDRVAAAFLSTDQVFPVTERIKEWLQEDRTENRTRKTVEEIEKMYYER